MSFIKGCLLGHRFTEIKGRIMCEKCGMIWEESQSIQKNMNMFRKIKKSVIIKKSDDIDKILEK